MVERPITILCLATEYKGVPFIEECGRQGAGVLLLTPESVAGDAWPWDSISDHFQMPDLHTQPDITYAVSYLARGHDIDRIVALDDYDVATAAALREHLRLPGLGETVARFFRDKLAMRGQAAASGLNVPRFTGLFNNDEVAEFLDTTPAPWVLKPRFEAGSIGIRKLHAAEDVWRALDELGDERANFLLEQFVPGDIYHVDTLTWDGRIVFGVASRYGAPPLALVQEGGIFYTRIMDGQSAESTALLALTQDMVDAFRYPQGVNHTEFIRSHADGRFYFLETSARVAGANIDRMIEAATGLSMWAEAARIELASVRGEAYQLPDYREGYAGLLICLSADEHPDLSSFDAPEVVWQVPKPYHAGLIVASADAARVESLVDEYQQRLEREFLRHVPNAKKARTTF